MRSLPKARHIKRQIEPRGLPVLQGIFDVIKSKSMSELKQTKVNLVENIVRIDYIKYIERRSEPSHLFHLIDSIPHAWRFDEKINFLTHRLRLYPAMPVITAHPTRVLSHEAVCLLYDIVALLGSLDEASHQKDTVALITQKINDLIQQTLVPKKTLTPDEESKMALYIYQHILESFPSFFNDVVHQFVTVHGGSKADVALLLKAPIMASFQNVCSWVKGDGDGNPNVTAETMKHAIPAQQIALLEVYIRQMDAIIELLHTSEQPDLGAALQAKSERFTRCIRDIKGRVWFDVVGSEEEKQSIFKVLDDLLKHTMPSAPVHHMIMNLRDLIELAGFYGGLKEFVRQTTTVHQHVWKNFSQILIQHHEDIAHLMLGRDYDALSDDEKTSLHDLLSSNTIYFETLHLHAGEFTPQTQDELSRLFLIRQNLDIFPSYIFSDTKGTINFSEARLAMHFAAHHFANSLKMRQVKEYPFNQLPLCETPEDLEQFDVILRSMLDNYHMRKKIVSSGFLSAVLGPSDNAKVAGIMVYGLLLRTQMLGEEILQTYKAIYPELEPVVWLWKHGFGSDMKRQFGAPQYQRHCTHQGWGALDVLAAPGAYASFLHGLVGFPCASQFKIEEIRLLKQTEPATYEAWLRIEKQAMDAFQSFMGQESVQALLAFMTEPTLERRMNISSRAGSKQSENPHEARAIGLVNHYMIGGDYWDMYWSVLGLKDLSLELKQHLVKIYQLTLCKDIIYKVFYSISVSRNTHSWKRIYPNQVITRDDIERWSQAYGVDDSSSYATTLAYIDKGKYTALEILIWFLPEDDQKKADVVLKNPAYRDKPAHELALLLMDAIGGEFAQLAEDTRERLPYVEQFRACVERYRKAPCPESEENAVLAGRGIQLAAPVPTITHLISPLHRLAWAHPIQSQPLDAAHPGPKL